MKDLKLMMESVLTAVFLTVASAYLSSYTLATHALAARFIYEDAEGRTFWRTGPPGSFLPWPIEPGMLEVLSPIGEVDLFIHTYLIKPRILAGLSILVWVITGLSVLRVTRHAHSESSTRATIPHNAAQLRLPLPKRID